MSLSLNNRLLVAASVALIAFLGLTGLALDQASQFRSQTAVQNRLHGQLFGLLAAADLDQAGVLQFPTELPEERFSRVNSGLYAEVVNSQGQAVWRSSSLLGRAFADNSALAPGESEFDPNSFLSEEPIFSYRFGIAWDDADGTSIPFVFSLAEDMTDYKREVGAFRRTLWQGLGGSAVLLLIVQALVLSWSLKPLRTLTEEIGRVELGEKDRLTTDYPKELESLAGNINILLNNERRLLRRYRNTLDDLAHSLKTPLAVLRVWLEDGPHARDIDANQQVDRMQQIVDYQLARVTAGRITFAKPIEVEPYVKQVLGALRKVYREKPVAQTMNIELGTAFSGDQGDLLEVLGNVLDNAYKYCRAEVRIKISSVAGERHPGLQIVVEDDGNGFPEGVDGQVMERGVRADTSTEGQGIGLAAVQDIVAAYDGDVVVENFEEGARVVVSFPSA